MDHMVYKLPFSHHSGNMTLLEEWWKAEVMQIMAIIAPVNQAISSLLCFFLDAELSSKFHSILVDGFNPTEKYARQNGNLPQNRDQN